MTLAAMPRCCKAVKLGQSAGVTPRFVGNEIYRRSTYGPKHPLAIPRVSTVTDLCRVLGWLPEAAYVTARMATEAQLTRFHDPAYIAALRRAEAAQSVSDADRARFRIGADGNPVYREVFSRPATSAGGMLMAAAMTGQGGTVYVPGGGTHHGRCDRASGFCYINDPVLAILAWLDAGLTRVVYLDLDAHHGDGVQDAFAGDARVLTISIHEAGRWPFTGLADDDADGSALNLPVPEGFHDDEFAFLLHEVVLPAIAARRPQALMVQCGADALQEDPLSRLALSNNAHASAIRAVRDLAPRLIVTGGGGYNPWSVGRCWARVWAALNDLAEPERLPEPAAQVLRGLTLNRAAGRNPPETWFTTLVDPPRGGAVRGEVRALAQTRRIAA